MDLEGFSYVGPELAMKDEHPFIDENWTKALNRLFNLQPVKNNLLEQDYADGLLKLFAPPAPLVLNNGLEEDYVDDVRSLFNLDLDFEYLWAGLASIHGGQDNNFDASEDFSNFVDENWTKALNRLFNLQPVKNNLLEQDYADGLLKLFAPPAPLMLNNLLEEDYGDAVRSLFNLRRPYFELDFDALWAGLASFQGVAGQQNSSDAGEELSDFELEGEYVPFYMVRAGKGSTIRNMKLGRQILKGGIYDGLPIMYGSYGPCGLEM